MSAARRVVVATDLSGASWRAVDRALALAARAGAGCTVVHALGADPSRSLAGWLGERADDVLARAIEARRTAVQAHLVAPMTRFGVACDVVVAAGPAVDAVRACVEHAQAGLLVVGAHGSGFVQRVLLGSTASALVRTSRCPVLVAKAPCRGPYRRALVPVDLSPASAAVVDAARTLASDADLVLLNVFELPYEGLLRYAGVDDDELERQRVLERGRATERLHALAERCGLPVGGYAAPVAHGDVIRGITTMERRYACDLVAVGKHGRRVVEDLLIGSVTERVLAESRSDVLVVPDRAAATPAEREQPAVGPGPQPRATP